MLAINLGRDQSLCMFLCMDRSRNNRGDKCNQLATQERRRKENDVETWREH